MPNSVSIDDDLAAAPAVINPISNYPNPFSNSTTLRLDLAKGGELHLSVYDLKGRKVRELLQTRKSAGTFELTWDATDDKGKKLASGIYFVRMRLDGKSYSKKLSIVH